MTTHGPSILERMWEMLDLHILALKDAQRKPSGVNCEEAAIRGGCLGIAKCIALIENPYDPDIDDIRQRAMERYEANRD